MGPTCMKNDLITHTQSDESVLTFDLCPSLPLTNPKRPCSDSSSARDTNVTQTEAEPSLTLTPSTCSLSSGISVSLTCCTETHVTDPEPAQTNTGWTSTSQRPGQVVKLHSVLLLYIYIFISVTAASAKLYFPNSCEEEVIEIVCLAHRLNIKIDRTFLDLIDHNFSRHDEKCLQENVWQL